MHSFFFFNDTATTEIYTLSLHDALPISVTPPPPNRLKTKPPTMAPAMPISIVTMMPPGSRPGMISLARPPAINPRTIHARSEEHTSELQSQSNIVCRLLLEKKNTPDSRH